MNSPRTVITVLGGSSVGTPVLIAALAKAQLANSLPSIEVRLYGRSLDRLKGIVKYSEKYLRSLANQNPNGEINITLEFGNKLDQLLPGTAIVLSQIRPGNMQGRSDDEEIARKYDFPADEGLGPSGLSNFLKGRELITSLAKSVEELSPQAIFLQMTSPLGLTVALIKNVTNLNCYGVCELPMTTSKKVVKIASPLLKNRPFEIYYAGLNHQSWIHSIRDASGKELIHDVIKLISDSTLFSVDPKIIQKQQAIPVPYLRLYYHQNSVVKEQKKQQSCRAQTLITWANKLDKLYLNYTDSIFENISLILSERNMNWYEEGVIPVISAFLSSKEQLVSLNLANGNTLPNLTPETIVELPCLVSKNNVNPLSVPALPSGPSQLMTKLVEYEEMALNINRNPDVDDISEVIKLHPFVQNSRNVNLISKDICKLLNNYLY